MLGVPFPVCVNVACSAACVVMLVALVAEVLEAKLPGVVALPASSTRIVKAFDVTGDPVIGFTLNVAVFPAEVTGAAQLVFTPLRPLGSVPALTQN